MHLQREAIKEALSVIAFSGEEEGLLGSKHFTDDPGIDLSKVNAMMNLDMVGRLNDTSMLQISGVGTAAGLKELIYSKSDTSTIKLKLSDEGYGPSDHSSFYFKNIPVLFYFTGAHLDYHTPADTWDKLNFPGMVEISTQIFNVGQELANSPAQTSIQGSRTKIGTCKVSQRKRCQPWYHA